MSTGKITRRHIGGATLAVMAMALTAPAIGRTVSDEDAIAMLQNALVQGHKHAPGCAHWGNLSVTEKLKLRGELGAAGFNNVSGTTNIASSTSSGFSSETQVVFLDFVSATGSITTALDPTLTANGADSYTYEEFDYVNTEVSPGISAADAVQARMEEDYAGFNVTFTQEQPTSGDFTTLFFNASSATDPIGSGPGVGFTPDGGIAGILFGTAGLIDFRNLSKNDTPAVDGNLWQVLADPEFLAVSGFSDAVFSLNTNGLAPTTENIIAATVNQTANTASHELGHAIGLRHRDSLGNIGQGTVSDPDAGVGAPGALPDFPGPTLADANTFTNLMASGASTGIPLGDLATEDRDFGPRSAIKLTFNDNDSTVNASDLAVAQTVNANVGFTDLFGFADTTDFVGDVLALELTQLSIPDTGPTADPFTAFVANVVGEITDPTVAQVFQVTFDTNVFLSVELMGDIFNAFDPDRFDIGQAIFGQLEILDEFFNPVDYFGTSAVNICEMEGCGNAFIFDLFLAAGSYNIAVYSPEALLIASGIAETTGGFELFVSAVVPGPAPIALLGLGLIGLGAIRRRKAAQ